MKFSYHKYTGFIFVAFCLMFSSLSAETEGTAITVKEKRQVIKFVAKQMDEHYVFEDIAKQLTDLMMNNLKEGVYDQHITHESFGSAVTKDLRSVNDDRHLWIWYYPDWVKNERERLKAMKKGVDPNLIEEKERNFDFEEIKVLEGNVGYLKFNSFSEHKEAYPIVDALFAFLQHCDALIIDLRSNNGGSPDMVQYICSYLLPHPPKHLNSLHYRNDSRIDEYWSLETVPGPRFVDRPVYLLVSGRTASAAEEFAYNMQNLERAIVVGDTTRGAAHESEFKIINDDYFMCLPVARAVNPISKTNWESIGVIPDIPIEFDKALEHIYEIIMNETDEVKDRK